MSQHRYPIVEVEWEDACHEAGWHNEPEEPASVPCTTVGMLVERNRKHVAVVLSRSEDGGWHTLKCIPRGMVKRIRRVGTTRIKW